MKTISLLAGRMPLYFLDYVFLQFYVSNIVFMFLLHYTCSVLRSKKNLEKRLSSYQNVWFCNCTEINIVIYALFTKQGIPPGGLRGGDMVTGRIEPCITEVAKMKTKNCEKRALFSIKCSRGALSIVDKIENWKNTKEKNLLSSIRRRKLKVNYMLP